MTKITTAQIEARLKETFSDVKPLTPIIFNKSVFKKCTYFLRSSVISFMGIELDVCVFSQSSNKEIDNGTATYTRFVSVAIDQSFEF
jgi:hypothetical protein